MGITGRSWYRRSRRRAVGVPSKLSERDWQCLWRYWPSGLLPGVATNLGDWGGAKGVGRSLSEDGRQRIFGEGGDGRDRGRRASHTRGRSAPGQSAIYARNPAMRSLMSKTQPIDKSGASGQGPCSGSARLRQPRPVAQDPDAGGRETVQGTRRQDHGTGDRGRGALPAVAQGS